MTGHCDLLLVSGKTLSHIDLLSQAIMLIHEHFPDVTRQKHMTKNIAHGLICIITFSRTSPDDPLLIK